MIGIYAPKPLWAEVELIRPTEIHQAQWIRTLIDLGLAEFSPSALLTEARTTLVNRFHVGRMARPDAKQQRMARVPRPL